MWLVLCLSVVHIFFITPCYSAGSDLSDASTESFTAPAADDYSKPSETIVEVVSEYNEQTLECLDSSTVFVPDKKQVYSAESTFGFSDHGTMLGFIPSNVDKEDKKFIKLLNLIYPNIKFDKKEGLIDFILPFKTGLLMLGNDTTLLGEAVLRDDYVPPKVGCWIRIDDTIIFSVVKRCQELLTGDYIKRTQDRGLQYRSCKVCDVKVLYELFIELEREYGKFRLFVKDIVGNLDYPGKIEFSKIMPCFSNFYTCSAFVNKPAAKYSKELFGWLLVYTCSDLSSAKNEEDIKKVWSKFVLLYNFIEPFENYNNEVLIALTQFIFMAHGMNLVNFKEVGAFCLMEGVDQLLGLFDKNSVDLYKYLGPPDYSELFIPNSSEPALKRKTSNIISFLFGQKNKGGQVSVTPLKSNTLPRGKEGYWVGRSKKEKRTTIRRSNSNGTTYYSCRNAEGKGKQIFWGSRLRNRKTSESAPELNGITEDAQDKANIATLTDPIDSKK